MAAAVEPLRIRTIRVHKLFGIFDHEIPLNLNERITIIHGPNGFGKTVILRMLNSLFREGLEILWRVPFQELAIAFQDESALKITRPGASLGALKFSYSKKPGGKPQTFTCEKPPESSKEPFDYRRSFPGWMIQLIDRIKVYFISTHRLISEFYDDGDYEPAVSFYASVVAGDIRSVLAQYASRSQELDSSFPERLFQRGKIDSLSLATLEQRLNQIEQKRSQLMDLGFLDRGEVHKSAPKLDKSMRDVLTVYVEDMEQKLAVFDEMAQKIQLLTTAVNRRFKYKRMRVSKDHGFLFESFAGHTPLPIESLSSGEQHELVLLYELLFKVSPNTLVLVDEPEISLHLAWQQQFLGDLVEMVKLSSFDVLIATHAPGIIGKRWDLTVELKGPDLENGKR